MQSVGAGERLHQPSPQPNAKLVHSGYLAKHDSASLVSCGVFVCRDLSSARMQLRGIVKQTEEKFSDTEAFTAIIAALQHTEQAMQRLKSQS